MSFSKNDLDIIKSKISIRNELEKKTKLVRKGKDYWCCCPFHEEKTPSCKINDESSSYYCFGCGAKGDIFTLYTELYNYNFIDAVKELSQRAGVQINFENIKKSKQDNRIEDIINISCLWFQHNLSHPTADICTKYLEKRKLSKETISAINDNDIDGIIFYSKRSAKIFIKLIKINQLSNKTSIICAYCLSEDIADILREFNMKVKVAKYPMNIEIIKLIN